MEITYKNDRIPEIDEIINLYDDSGLKRPTDDKARITKMYDNANLVVTAWEGDKLVGIARSLSDFSHCCYLADLAVSKDYQHKGIGKELVAATKEAIGEESMLLLLSAHTALEYYPKIGMETVKNGFIIHRTI